MMVAFFCDVPSLWYTARRFGGERNPTARVDYSKLLRTVVGGREMAFAKAYVWEKPGMDSFFKALSHLGYEMKYGEDGVPMTKMIATDLLATANQWDVAIVASGEGRYTETFRRLRKMGKQIEVYTFPIECPILEMAYEVDRYLPLTDDVLYAPDSRANGNRLAV